MQQVLKSHRAHLQVQIARQTDLIKTGEKMLAFATREISLERFEHARVSLSGARSAFTRASGKSELDGGDYARRGRRGREGERGVCGRAGVVMEVGVW